MSRSRRITKGADLGRTHRWLDLILGVSALVPLFGAAVDVWLTASDVSFISSLAMLWSGALLAFFAGVRRGLTFSEAGGARPFELISMLWLFVMGAATVILESAATAVVGFMSVGVLDVVAARAEEAPPYFRLFRPVQMAFASLCLCAIVVRELTAPAS